MNTAHARLDIRRRIVEAMEFLRHDPKFLSLLVAANGMRTVTVTECGNGTNRVQKTRNRAAEEYLCDIRAAYNKRISEYVYNLFKLRANVDCWSFVEDPENYLWKKVGLAFFSDDADRRLIARVAIEIGDVVFEES
jgi:hypothetical protein